jgi:hypothetical protein
VWRFAARAERGKQLLMSFRHSLGAAQALCGGTSLPAQPNLQLFVLGEPLDRTSQTLNV